MIIRPDVEICKERVIFPPGMYARHYSPKAAVILVEEKEMGTAIMDRLRKAQGVKKNYV